ncbi:DUF4129 domain-containing protein [Ruicaihuangia caeni]|uniref:DUF4129 domain-containing protein n=1 Tax=Ruicaihuangia caeni TaxID=3042517 RepID=UPI00338F3CCC
MRLTEAPLDPSADEAREWVLRELADPAYQAAQPTWWDRLSQAFWEWLTSLELGGGEGPPVLALAVIGGLIAIGLLVAFLVYGLPRLNKRSAATIELFGDDDTRDAAELRRAAQLAASAERWDEAIAESFRAIARGLVERTLVQVLPGTTATEFARRASAVFVDERDELAAAASAFDRVRYLGEPGTRETYERMTALDTRLRQRRASEVLPA